MNSGGTGNKFVANDEDYSPVFILFLDSEIKTLFSELLSARGIKNEVIYSMTEFKSGTKIITEPIYFPQIPDKDRSKCLIVGNGSSLKDMNGICLPRPLTEEKIEEALAELLKA